jgi:hypothetical protein
MGAIKYLQQKGSDTVILSERIVKDQGGIDFMGAKIPHGIYLPEDFFWDTFPPECQLRQEIRMVEGLDGEKLQEACNRIITEIRKASLPESAVAEIRMAVFVYGMKRKYLIMPYRWAGLPKILTIISDERFAAVKGADKIISGIKELWALSWEAENVLSRRELGLGMPRMDILIQQLVNCSQVGIMLIWEVGRSEIKDGIIRIAENFFMLSQGPVYRIRKGRLKHIGYIGHWEHENNREGSLLSLGVSEGELEKLFAFALNINVLQQEERYGILWCKRDDDFYLLSLIPQLQAKRIEEEIVSIHKEQGFLYKHLIPMLQYIRKK